MTWYVLALLVFLAWSHGRAVRKLGERVAKLEADMPLPDKHYAPDIDPCAGGHSFSCRQGLAACWCGHPPMAKVP